MERKSTMATETVVQQQTRLAFARIGPAWRNNVGACEDATGRLIRYGLGNDSAQLNKENKSSDLIGITPVTAYLASAGAWVTLGVFTALEVKRSDWHPTPSDDRAIAQAKFHAIVREVGGFAGFVTDPADVHKIIRQF
jgi:hypothetical protein